MGTTEIRNGAEDVHWDLDPLVDGDGTDGVHRHLHQAARLATELTESDRGTIGDIDGAGLAAVMSTYGEIVEHLRRAFGYAQLRWSTDAADDELGALLQHTEEQQTTVQASLAWFRVEWLAIDSARAEELVAHEALAPYAKHLREMRRWVDHVLTEPEERLLTETSVTARSAWVRLFEENSAVIKIDLPDEDEPVNLPTALARLYLPDSGVRAQTASSLTAGLQPGLKTRAFALNTLVSERALRDRLRGWPTWISEWNATQETTDDAVDALVSAVTNRYDTAQRWYRTKAQLLGSDRLAHHDRHAAVVDDDTTVSWDGATTTVLDALGDWSPTLADIAGRFVNEGWIDAPTAPAKRGGAFCHYTVPSHHPYVFLNFTGGRDDVLTLAHELGHGIHGYLAREQGIFHQSTPLTVAETASVFGETLTLDRMLAADPDPAARLALLATSVEGNIATVFRQVALNRFEDAVHTHRRQRGELSVDDISGHWMRTQADLVADTVDLDG
jgi:oligoendopeptidase F